MRFAVPLSRMLARMHLWYPAAVVLAQTPLAAMGRHSVGRLSYALMMTHRARRGSATALFHRLLEDNAQRSPSLALEMAEMATRMEAPAMAEDLLLEAQTAADAAGEASSSDAARRLRALAIALREGSLQKPIARDAAAIAEASPNDPLVLVPLSSAYLDLFHLWHAQVRRHVGTRVVVLAMDDAAMEYLQNVSDATAIDCRAFFTWHEGKLHTKTRGVLWLIRVLYLRALVQRGHTVLVLDLDAVPVGDVRPMLARLQDSDVVAQTDHSIPMDVDRQLGFVLCCGFMLWRPTRAAMALLDRFATATQIERDDQLALNHLLAAEGIVEKTTGADAIRFRCGDVRFACPDPSEVSRTLHSGSVVRHFHQQGQSMAQLRHSLGIPQKSSSEAIAALREEA